MIQMKLDKVTAGYGEQVILTDVSFEVAAGDYISIIGENGSGKTTLMKTLLGILKPLSGEIIFTQGEKVVGYLPQHAEIQKDFPASVFEVVLTGCQRSRGRRPFYNAAEKAAARKNMERMGIADLSGKCFHELSGGQRQRVLLARALCATDKLLVLDEPVTGLDPENTENLYEMIRKLNDEGTTIIMITHDMEKGLLHAKRVLKVEDGLVREVQKV